LRGDRGSVSAELVIATPLLLLMVLAIVQFALWSHATHIAQTAASQGLAAARVQNATAAQGLTGAQHVLDQLGRGPLINTRIDTRRGADAASIRVIGEASAVIPFLHLSVHAETAGPLERFTPDLPAGGR
jgi:Flp pilus assembly protein TadG